MKNIEISAEWILNNLPSITEAVGNGRMILVVDNISDSLWISFALDSMGVKYESDIIEEEELNVKVQTSLLVFWKFRIEEIKEECPVLYAEWTRLDLINSSNRNRN
jgi:hypothetical protein